MGRSFKISRADGRSNAEVLLGHVKAGEPGRIYTYEELSAVLSEGTETVYTPANVRTIVGNPKFYKRMLKLQDRALRNIPRVGYRLALAKEMPSMFMVRKDRADVQMECGLLTLQHTRTDELDEATRRVHEGMLMIVGAVYQQQQAMDRRLRAVEDAVRGLKGSTAKAG